jgi:hypothetical protein
MTRVVNHFFGLSPSTLIAFALAWLSDFRLALLLLRGYRCRLLRKFKAFYGYITADLAGSLLISAIDYRDLHIFGGTGLSSLPLCLPVVPFCRIC